MLSQEACRNVEGQSPISYWHDMRSITRGENDLSSLNELLVLNDYFQITINLRWFEMVLSLIKMLKHYSENAMAHLIKLNIT